MTTPLDRSGGLQYTTMLYGLLLSMEVIIGGDSGAENRIEGVNG